MGPFPIILHPTDFSEFSTEAFRVACALAGTLGSRLILLHANQPPMIVAGEMIPVPVDTVTARQNSLAQLHELVPTLPAAQVERYVVDGNPAEEIVRFAEDRHCSVIVMGTHGRTGLRRLLLGSIAELVVRRAPCPVLTVKPHPAEVPAVEKEVEFAHR